MSRSKTKPKKWPVRPAKTHIRLGGSDQSLRCALFRIAKDPKFLHADLADAQSDLRLCWAHISVCLFCCAVAQMIQRKNIFVP